MLRRLRHQPDPEITNPFALRHFARFLRRNAWFLVLGAGLLVVLLYRPAGIALQTLRSSGTTVVVTPDWDLSKCTIEPVSWPDIPGEVIPVMATATSVHFGLFDLEEDRLLFAMDLVRNFLSRGFSQYSNDLIVCELRIPFLTQTRTEGWLTANMPVSPVDLFAWMLGRSHVIGFNTETLESREIAVAGTLLTIRDLSPDGRYLSGISGDAMTDHVWSPMMAVAAGVQYWPLIVIDLVTGEVHREPILATNAYFTDGNNLVLFRRDQILLYDWRSNRLLEILATPNSDLPEPDRGSRDRTLFSPHSLKKVTGGREVLCFPQSHPWGNGGPWARIRIPLHERPTAKDLVVETLPPVAGSWGRGISGYGVSPNGDLYILGDPPQGGGVTEYEILHFPTGRIIATFGVSSPSRPTFVDDETVVFVSGPGQVKALKISEMQAPEGTADP